MEPSKRERKGWKEEMEGGHPQEKEREKSHQPSQHRSVEKSHLEHQREDLKAETLKKY